MNVLISGSSGMVGKALSAALKAQGHGVTPLTRGNAEAGEIHWDPASGKLDSGALKGVDAVVHLAGESIAGRWTASKKKAIRESRVLGTTTLCDALAKMAVPPKVLVSASAVGFYGNRGDDVMTETSAPGTGFLPEVCQAWEAATASAEKAGIRTVRMRLGVVLSSKGGALATMLTPFKMGVGGVVGSGKQYMSWIALDDVVGAIVFALMNPNLSGAVNLVAPNPATNYDFTKALGKVLSRPTIFPLPGFVIKLLFGEMGNDLLLEGTRATPTQLQKAGFAFKYPDLDGALKAAING